MYLMNRITNSLFLTFILLVLTQWACVPPSNEVKTDINIDPADQTFQDIKDYQDRQEKDSLYAFFRHDDPTYRYLAAVAFASIRDSSANDSLAFLLDDPVDRVRAAAAYAIGQAGAEGSDQLLIDAFDRQDTAGYFSYSNRAILEAVGKTGGAEMLEALSTITTYAPTDTFLLEGQSWGIYRYALRGIINEKGTERMLNYATDENYPVQVRLIAAHYLSRAQEITLDSLMGLKIAAQLKKEENVNIRMPLVIALGKVKSEAALQQLKEQFGQEKDYRVQANILASLSNYDYVKVQEMVLGALKSPYMAVAKRATQYLIDHGSGADATFYWRTAKDTLPWQIQLGLYQAANRHLPAYFVDYRDAINAELRQRLFATSSPYERSAALRAMAEFPWNYKYIYQQGFKSESPIIRTATMEALASISDRPDFRGYFRGSYRTVRRELMQYFQEAMQSGDPGMIAVAAKALRNKSLGYDRYIDSLSLLNNALERLELPKEIETYNELQHTIAFLQDEAAPPPRMPAYNHPIDWSMLNSIADGKHVYITTSKGEVKLELLPQEAPGTVANFIALVKQGFYKDKTFHRVVPNFVVQGGCPRGDGYGSLDYTIRSELPPLHYDEAGYVGMASAGNHTECTQFFITHSPTPHLDGNYTIFAKVIDGMNIVHDIQVGDPISSIAIK